jgi:hypothetical protein
MELMGGDAVVLEPSLVLHEGVASAVPDEEACSYRKMH